jgi:hypothetical protein
MATSAMYYPHIHFRSRSWLRSALLYYDQITRIVPEGMIPDSVDEYAKFSWEAKELAYEVNELTDAGFIRSQPPEVAAVNQTADDFLAFASKNLTDPVRRKAVLPALRRRNPYISVHPSKIDPGLVDILKELGLAHKKTFDPYDDLDAATAVLYLMHLSINQSKGRPLITDNVLYQRLLYSDAENSNGERVEKQDGSFLLVAAAFQSIVPANLDRVPIRDLLDFREKHGAALARFQNQITSLAGRLSEAKDENDLNIALEAQATVIDEEKRILEDKLRGNNLACATGLFSVSVPAYILHVASSHPTLIAGAAAAAISATLFKFSLDRRVTKGSNPYSYLLDVESFLSAREFSKDLVTLDFDDGFDERYFALAL